VIGLYASVPALAVWIFLPVLAGITVVSYLVIKYTPKVVRIFEEQPVLMPLRVSPVEPDETVALETEDGLSLAGSYFRHRGGQAEGIFVFCHEFLSDRFGFHPYIDSLRDTGYDIFAFDFRNHGASDCDTTYQPTQWTSDRELRDLSAALAYLRSRHDHDAAGFGLFGVSRGGTTALVGAARERDVWGVITDGAFPTRGTMDAYIHRWAEIYVPNPFLRGLIPEWLYSLLAWVSRRFSERRLNCRFLDAEAAVAKLHPRPWLMIHGQRDAYIPPEIAEGLFECGSGPKHLWIVPDAKHNRCRDCAPEAYNARLVEFLERYAPRRPLRAALSAVSSGQKNGDAFGVELESLEFARRVATPIPG
jgi:pimeloyl-ACP methyl ester carboxylesterase